MSALAGPLHLVALVLVVSGVQKVIVPGPPTRAMRDAGLPLPRRESAWPGVALGVVEACTGLAVFAIPHAGAALWLGAFYLALAAFVVLLRRRDATAGCGCFGAASTPPTTAHIVVNVLGAGVALAAAVLGVPDGADILDEGLGVVVAYAILTVTGAVLALRAPALLAQLDSAVEGGGVADPMLSEPDRVPRRDVRTGRDRIDRIDRDLADAGIEAGDPRLFHDHAQNPS